MNQEDKIYQIYFEKLKNCGVSEESCNVLKEKYGDALCNASYATSNEAEMAYDGSLIEIMLKKLAVYAVKINGLYPEDIRVDVSSLVKVCLLQHISKCIRMEKSTDNWRINRGELYTYKAKQPAIGTGLHSLAIATECGIQFTPVEVEAMVCNDRADDDLQFKYHSSMLTSIVKQANECVYMEFKKKKNIIE